jgi:hypothetical protein
VHGLLGAFLAFQASRVRFRFSDTDLDVVFIEPGAADSTALEADTGSSGDNKLQGGGANKWALSSITNWCARGLSAWGVARVSTPPRAWQRAARCCARDATRPSLTPKK